MLLKLRHHYANTDISAMGKRVYQSNSLTKNKLNNAIQKMLKASVDKARIGAVFRGSAREFKRN